MWNNAPITATLSAGIAFHSETTSDWNDLLRQADQALYEAKKSGRNQLFTANGQNN
jgi:diguanylate cyclase (GGDEF)-like protein